MGDLAETIEKAALLDLHEAATPEVVAGLGLSARQTGDVLLSSAARLPPSAIVINRTLGIEEPVDENLLQDIVASYREARVSRYFLQTTAGDAAAKMQAAGLTEARAWQKFVLSAESLRSTGLPEHRSQLEVRAIDQAHGREFAEIVCNGFDLGEQAIPWLSLLPGRPNWHVLMSFERGRPAGVGTMFIQDEVAWFDWAATDPAYRRRGSQTAILVKRIKLALELGCEQMFTCTGVAVAGDPQHSYGNISRVGFRESYVRGNFAPA